VKLKNEIVKIALRSVIAVILIAISIDLGQSLRDSSKRDSFTSVDIVDYSTEKPLEEEVIEYAVPDNQPRRISIPSIGATGFIQMVGIDQHGRIAVPTNVHLAGWYVNSLKPGEKGLSIISAHKDGIGTTGLFSDLQELRKGDLVVIEYGNNDLYEFEVVEVTQISREKAQDEIYKKNPDIESQLTLITCGGEFSRREKTYLDRIVVVTSLKN
jgi:LPXTG-site transpeptidase (sortase) family protein